MSQSYKDPSQVVAEFPVQVSIPEFVVSVACGPFVSAAVTSAGNVFTWGKLANHNLSAQQLQPRRVDYFHLNNLFVSKVRSCVKLDCYGMVL